MYPHRPSESESTARTPNARAPAGDEERHDFHVTAGQDEPGSLAGRYMRILIKAASVCSSAPGTRTSLAASGHAQVPKDEENGDLGQAGSLRARGPRAGPMGPRPKKHEP